MKKAMALLPILLIALSVVGFAYATWSQILYIDVTVNTGELCVGLRDVGVNDLGNDPGFDIDTDEQVYYDKDVASITSENYVWKCEHEGEDYYEREVITITNAYPSYAPGWTTKIANCGTIPVKITGIDIDPWPFPDWIELLKWIKYEDGTEVARGASHPIPNYPNYGAACLDRLVVVLMDEQLDPCDTISVYIELHTTQEFGDMPMDDSFSFTVEVTFTQWNA